MERKKVGLKKGNNVLVVINLIATAFVFVFVIILFLSDNDRDVDSSASIPVAVQVPTQIVNEDNTEYLDLSNNDPEVGGIVQRVSKHMLLPRGDITVATVNDPDGLREQNPDMFQYVKQGDKLLAYPNGIIIYDPVVDKIVDVIRIPASIEGLESN